MGRAIALLSRPASDVILITAGMAAAVEVCRRWTKGWSDGYRPELHYMRGPGPKWLEKHAGQTGAIVVLSEGHHDNATLGRRIELMLRHWLPNRWRMAHRATHEIQWADRLGPWSV